MAGLSEVDGHFYGNRAFRIGSGSGTKVINRENPKNNGVYGGDSSARGPRRLAAVPAPDERGQQGNVTVGGVGPHSF